MAPCTTKLGPKAQARKDSWIQETQNFQTIARGGEPADSYETLSVFYDQDAEVRAEQKREYKLKKAKK